MSPRAAIGRECSSRQAWNASPSSALIMRLVLWAGHPSHQERSPVPPQPANQAVRMRASGTPWSELARRMEAGAARPVRGSVPVDAERRVRRCCEQARPPRGGDSHSRALASFAARGSFSLPDGVRDGLHGTDDVSGQSQSRPASKRRRFCVIHRRRTDRCSRGRDWLGSVFGFLPRTPPTPLTPARGRGCWPHS